MLSGAEKQARKKGDEGLFFLSQFRRPVPLFQYREAVFSAPASRSQNHLVA
jgi:hypothetical protein